MAGNLLLPCSDGDSFLVGDSTWTHGTMTSSHRLRKKAQLRPTEEGHSGE